jgi:hypothetical protein
MATLSISSILTLRQFPGFRSYPRRGQEPDKQLRAAFADLSFGGTAGLSAEGDCVVGRWAGGMHTACPAERSSGRAIYDFDEYGRLWPKQIEQPPRVDTRACSVMPPRVAHAGFLYTDQKAAACRGCCRS